MAEILQGSPEWFNLKRGKFSASKIVGLCKGTKGSYIAARKNYIAQVVCEIMTGKTAETYKSFAMNNGTETEPIARQAYEVKTGEYVDEVAFIDHPDILRLGASPDGLIGIDGGLEIKCPEDAQHLATLRNGAIKRDYIYQIQTCLMCTGRKWWDFVSYNPYFPEQLQLYIKRFKRDENILTEIVYEVNKASVEVDKILDELGYKE